MQKETKNTPVVKTQQNLTNVPVIQPTVVDRRLGDEFTINDKQVVVVEVDHGEYHVKNKNEPFDSFWI